ncbi:MAG: hypothetical protein DSZ23_04045 [Thermodesulfatator sp.]|nr:MAG: hypothetical protein DSZ23_04045 [Thermodesulfatator sp.]
MSSRPVVLLVDHRPESKPIFQQVAEKFPFELLVAEDGQAGFDIAMEVVPDLIVIRQDIPILNAQSVSVLLKQSAETDKIPIMVLCSRLSQEEKEKFQDAGCNDCIKEPVEIDVVIAKIKEWLPL